VRKGNTQAAVETYERAVGFYEESGLVNNAIALCNKILRNAPGRTPVYLKLAKLMVQRGFVAEAKQNLLEYAERMERTGQVDEAFTALKEFADLSPDSEELRLLLAEQLKAAARTEEAKEQLEKLYHELEAKGDQRKSRDTLGKIKAIDPDFEAGEAPQRKAKEGLKTSELVFLDLDDSPAEPEAPAAVAEPPAKEVAAEQPVVEEPVVEEAAPAIEIEPTAVAEEEAAEPAAPIEPIELERGSADYLVPDLAVEEISGLDAGSEFEAPAREEVASLDIEPTTVGEGVAAEDVPVDHIVTEEEATAAAVEPDTAEVEGMERVSEGFVPPDAMIEPPQDDQVAAAAPPAVEPEVAPETERVSEGFVPPDAIIEPPAEAQETAAPAAPAAASDELDVPDLDLSAGIGEEQAAARPTEPAAPAAPAAQGAAAAPPAHDDYLSPSIREVHFGDTPVPEGIGAAVEEQPAEEAIVERQTTDMLAAEVEAAAAAAAAAAIPTGLDELENRVADDPDDPALHRALGEALMEAGDRERGLEELDIALELHEHGEDWRHAESLAEEILRLDPNSVRHHQKLVEFAFRRGAKDRLAEAYLGLADALFRTGAAERARAVYQRVMEHDPDNERAQLGLQTLEPTAPGPAAPAEPEAPAAEEPAAAAAAPSSDFVDLGALVFEEEISVPVKDTRMRIEEEEPTGDEQKDFEEMLSQFKKGIEQNVDEEDWQAHYDLGIAFKEMGLLDEAISSFQKALRSQQGRLRAAEALGLCFFEKGQFSVAGTVLRRAVETERGGDEGMIGLLYWLGRCEQEQGRTAEALGSYQRVFAIDIKFQDVSERVKDLAGAGG
jgi:tetratricopeptide (TPR) repeat protein